MKIQFSIQKREDGGLELSWLATPGATYQAERSYHSEGPLKRWVKNIVPLPLGANCSEKGDHFQRRSSILPNQFLENGEIEITPYASTYRRKDKRQSRVE
jgi:hypothetical protein